MPKWLKYEGKFTIYLEPNTDLSVLSIASGDGDLEIKKENDKTIVSVINGLITQNISWIQFYATKKGDTWWNPFAWPEKYLQKILDEEGNIIWPRNAK